jgi:hypothetical protein
MLMARRRALVDRYEAAIAEVVEAVRRRLEQGAKPSRARAPSVSVFGNRMPTISDGDWSGGGGPPDHVALLEPPYGDDAARQRGRYPPKDFPEMAALVACVAANGDLSVAFPPGEHAELLGTLLRLQVEGAANLHFLRFGPVAWSSVSARVILPPLLKGLFAPRLDLAIVVPIALTSFEPGRVRLAPDVLLLRMTEALQRVRWSAKAYGGSGHATVLSAATHALVLTGWGIDNGRHWNISQRLGWFSQEVRDRIDEVFSVIRLETGIDTGYAQVLWLSRRWRLRHHFDDPEVHAAGARRYPDSFDNYGWLREELPELTRGDLDRVASALAAVRAADEPRLAMALRRLNAAMVRDDAADAVLDATIGLELLLGDSDGQAINWKMRMRAAALAGIDGDKAAMDATHASVGEVYGLRSAIVHGARGRSRRDVAADPLAGRTLAIETLRETLRRIIAAPRYLDPLKIDRELMLVPSAGGAPDQGSDP